MANTCVSIGTVPRIKEEVEVESDVSLKKEMINV